MNHPREGGAKSRTLATGVRGEYVNTLPPAPRAYCGNHARQLSGTFTEVNPRTTEGVVTTLLCISNAIFYRAIFSETLPYTFGLLTSTYCGAQIGEVLRGVVTTP